MLLSLGKAWLPREDGTGARIRSQDREVVTDYIGRVEARQSTIGKARNQRRSKSGVWRWLRR